MYEMLRNITTKLTTNALGRQQSMNTCPFKSVI